MAPQNVNYICKVVEIFSKYNNIMRDQKMTAEKGVMSPDQAEQRPLKNGIVTFVGFGSAPLSSFIVLKPFTDNEWVMFLGASFMSAIALTLLGVAKAKISGKSYAVSVGLVLLTGAVAALAAYLLGWTLLIKVEDD
ncbi:uncharacterized protein LOC120161064 [Hibiscus syriacus]|uniref:uncharacterized protein LOC120161064 n=1 Tax=Hibiscus syriacus TaxID=106335 RepID=UPI00192057EB|nr:uncharacterized protein LOC120161064 [Hibiscus syriacus]